MSCLRVYLRGIFRPSVTNVRVDLYANGKECDISIYDEVRLAALLDSIQELWQVPSNTAFWFETDAFVARPCFRKSETTIHVTCYKNDMYSNGFKTKIDIPLKYRQKLFDKSHRIYPTGRVWPEMMTVRFRLV
jgi:hypothetical protein